MMDNGRCSCFEIWNICEPKLLFLIGLIILNMTLLEHWHRWSILLWKKTQKLFKYFWITSHNLMCVLLKAMHQYLLDNIVVRLLFFLITSSVFQSNFCKKKYNFSFQFCTRRCFHFSIFKVISFFAFIATSLFHWRVDFSCALGNKPRLAVFQDFKSILSNLNFMAFGLRASFEFCTNGHKKNAH